MTVFHFVRHGQIDRTQDLIDPPLSAHGLTQAQAVVAYLRTLDIDQIYTSPLRRSAETAAIIAAALDLPVQQDARLRERANFGDIPGQSLADFVAMWEACNLDRDRTPPGGASSRAAGRRVEEFVTDVYDRSPAAAVVAVCHGGTIADFLRNIASPSQLAAVHPAFAAQPYDAEIMRECAVTTVHFDAEGYTIQAIAQVAG